MINAHVSRPSPEPANPCESEEQREQRIKLDILKRWEIIIHLLDRGCIVKIGCKSIAFENLDAGSKEIGRYLDNPRLVASEYGFGEHL